MIGETLLVAIVCLLGTFLCLELSLLLLAAIVPVLRVKEFPTTTRESLEKFSSFDPELGWVPQPNSSKLDRDSNPPAAYAIDEFGSRVLPGKQRRSGEYCISTYGDSFCFCREVNDAETWQYHLSQQLNCHVSNYGVGNYGADQAVIRLAQQYQRDPTPIVILAITPWTVMRILSVWKHYSEFGNTFAVKPRFTLEQGRLRLIGNVISQKEDLLQLQSLADWLRHHDYHYRNWFLTHQPKLPYTTHLLKNPRVWYKAVCTLGLGLMFHSGAHRVRRLYDAIHYGRSLDELHYKRELFQKELPLFVGVVGEFVRLSCEHNFQPILLMLPGYEDVVFQQKHGSYYGPALEEVSRAYPDLDIVDFFDKISCLPDPSRLFTRSKFGWPGHFNGEANRMVAAAVSDHVQQLPPCGFRHQRESA